MNLPIVDPFLVPLELWNERRPTFEEARLAALSGANPTANIRVNIEMTLRSPLDAALHIAKIGADNRVGTHIESFCKADRNFQAWRKAMPSRTPLSLSQYQKLYPKYDSQQLSNEVSRTECVLSDGQYIFHGGQWPGGDSQRYITDRPLSTSLCPQVAMPNAEHKGKAYNSGVIHLLALRAYRSTTNVFVFRQSGTLLGHELEVLFASDATLHVEKVHTVNTAYRVGGIDGSHKLVPVLVVEALIS